MLNWLLTTSPANQRGCLWQLVSPKSFPWVLKWKSSWKKWTDPYLHFRSSLEVKPQAEEGTTWPNFPALTINATAEKHDRRNWDLLSFSTPVLQAFLAESRKVLYMVAVKVLHQASQDEVWAVRWLRLLQLEVPVQTLYWKEHCQRRQALDPKATHRNKRFFQRFTQDSVCINTCLGSASLSTKDVATWKL